MSTTMELQNEIQERRAHLRGNISVVRVLRGKGIAVDEYLRVIREDRKRLRNALIQLRKRRNFATC